MPHDDQDNPEIELLNIQDGFNSQHDSHPTSHAPSHEQTPERELDEPPPYTPSPNPPRQAHLRPTNAATSPPDILPTYTPSPPGLPPPLYKARICGLQRRTFFLLAFAIPAVILIIVAGTLSKILLNRHDNSSNNNNTSSNPNDSVSNSNGPQQTVSAAPLGGIFTFKGCFTDGQTNPSGDRTFERMTIIPKSPPYNYTQCASANGCASFQFFGTENTGQCFCSNVITGDSTQVDTLKCDPNCASGLCGAPNYMLVYQNVLRIS